MGSCLGSGLGGGDDAVVVAAGQVHPGADLVCPALNLGVVGLFAQGQRALAGGLGALPTPGGPGDFPRLVDLLASGGDPSRAAGSRAARALWAIRGSAGRLLGWDRP